MFEAALNYGNVCVFYSSNIHVLISWLWAISSKWNGYFLTSEAYSLLLTKTNDINGGRIALVMSSGSRVRQIQVQIQPLLLTSCLTLGKLICCALFVK